MTLEYFITTYGYLAVVVGTFFEGETILVLGGFAAHRGYLDLGWVILAAFVGSLIGDQLYFFIGRWRSHGFLAKRPSWQAKVQRAHRLLERHHTLLILGFRFVYGVRTVVPFVIGTSRVPVWRFVLFNVIGAAIWAVVVGLGGYLFGHALEVIISDIKHYELEAMLAILVIGTLAWLFHHRRSKKI